MHCLVDYPADPAGIDFEGARRSPEGVKEQRR